MLPKQEVKPVSGSAAKSRFDSRGACRGRGSSQAGALLGAHRSFLMPGEPHLKLDPRDASISSAATAAASMSAGSLRRRRPPTARSQPMTKASAMSPCKARACCSKMPSRPRATCSWAPM